MNAEIVSYKQEAVSLMPVEYENHSDVEDQISDVDITNQSSINHETDSSDEIDDNRDESDELFDEREMVSSVKVEPSAAAIYQQNCLAAAQMMQLLYSNNSSSSASSIASNTGDQLNTSPQSNSSVHKCSDGNQVARNVLTQQKNLGFG